MTPETYISSFELNQITARRASLTFEEAVAVSADAIDYRNQMGPYRLRVGVSELPK